MAKDRSEKASRAPKTIALAMRRLNALADESRYPIGMVCHGQKETRDLVMDALTNAVGAAAIEFEAYRDTREVLEEIEYVLEDIRDATRNVVVFIVMGNTMDPNTPDEGAEFVSELRAEYGHLDIPVLMMADEITEKLQGVLDRGEADGIIGETFGKDRNLIAAVVRAINHRYDILTQTKNE